MSQSCVTIICRVSSLQGGGPRDVPAAIGVSLMRSLKDAGVDIEASCEGCLACGTCMVHLDAGWAARVPPPTPDEEVMLEWMGDRRPTSRLACQIRVTEALDGITLEVAA
jgi:ferredoxin